MVFLVRGLKGVLRVRESRYEQGEEEGRREWRLGEWGRCFGYVILVNEVGL